MTQEKIIIFDTALRDGEQSPFLVTPSNDGVWENAKHFLHRFAMQPDPVIKTG
jgi:hypothetical protein